MSRRADTADIIADGDDEELVQVKRATRSSEEQQQYPAPRSSTNVTSLCSAYAVIFQRKNMAEALVKDERGTVVRYSHDVYLPRTSSITVSVGDRIYRSGSDDWLEVVTIRTFSDHLELAARETEGR